MELEIRRNCLYLSLSPSFAKYETWKSGLILSLSGSQGGADCSSNQSRKAHKQSKAKAMQSKQRAKGAADKA
jgi:hypothetical protein